MIKTSIMIFLSAGHNPKGKNQDPGAVANGKTEAELTVELRGLIAYEITHQNGSVIIDNDSERLAEYIKRIHPGSGSVVCEIHFNAGTPSATGTESIVRVGAKKQETDLANSINGVIHKHADLNNRGVKIENKTPHKRLGILHTGAGISVLVEICFITNKTDLDKYQKAKKAISRDIAKLLIDYDKMFT